jgi:protein gp37
LTKRPERILDHLPKDWGNGWDHVWLGVSVENQAYIYRKNILVEIPARTRFISAEPLLGFINLGKLQGIHWVITGGESGPNSRKLNLDWVRNIREQCTSQRISFFHKQNGGKRKIDGAWGGRLLDGRTWDEMPLPIPV